MTRHTARSPRLGGAAPADLEPAPQAPAHATINGGTLAGRAHVARRLRRAIVPGALLLYSAILLWPYDFEPPRRVTNGAAPLPGGGITFAGPGLAHTKRPAAWLQEASRDSRLGLSLSVRSAVLNQTGPASILAISSGPHQRNLVLGQQGSDLVLWLRTPQTGANGSIDGGAVAQVPNVFEEPGWIDLTILIKPEELQIAVGEQVRVQEVLSPAPLRTWDDSFPLVLGNELSRNHPWLGSIRRAIVRTGEVTRDYAAPGAMQRPLRYWWFESSPKLAPFGDASGQNLLAHLFLYLPLGFLLGLSRGPGNLRGAALAALMITALSATLEGLQMFLPVRQPSIDHVILGTLGGALGIALGRRSSRPNQTASRAPAHSV